MKLHGSQLRQQEQDHEHTLHQLTTQEPPARLKKQTIFHNNNYTTNIDTPPDTTQETIRVNTAQIHTQINRLKPHAGNSPQQNTKQNTTRNKQHRHYTRRLLAQLRSNKSPILYTNTCTKLHQNLTQHQTVLYTTHRHISQNTYSTSQGCQPTWAPRRCGTILGGGGGGAAGLLAHWSDQLGWGLERG